VFAAKVRLTNVKAECQRRAVAAWYGGPSAGSCMDYKDDGNASHGSTTSPTTPGAAVSAAPPLPTMKSAIDQLDAVSLRSLLTEVGQYGQNILRSVATGNHHSIIILLILFDSGFNLILVVVLVM
jgi:hypothetical protein